jgi:cytoskeletal protein RodZ
MSTGSFENWAGTITDIGPLYPFVGTEVLWFILGLAFWIWWQVVQAKRENKVYEEEIKRFGSVDALTKIVNGETPEDA